MWAFSFHLCHGYDTPVHIVLVVPSNGPFHCCISIQDSLDFQVGSIGTNISGLIGNIFHQICLPIALQFSIENGTGVIMNAFASEEDVVFVFEFGSIRELNIAFYVSRFHHPL